MNGGRGVTEGGVWDGVWGYEKGWEKNITSPPLDAVMFTALRCHQSLQVFRDAAGRKGEIKKNTSELVKYLSP